jgi:hypothetical protein
MRRLNAYPLFKKGTGELQGLPATVSYNKMFCSGAIFDRHLLDCLDLFNTPGEILFKFWVLARNDKEKLGLGRFQRGLLKVGVEISMGLQKETIGRDRSHNRACCP